MSCLANGGLQHTLSTMPHLVAKSSALYLLQQSHCYCSPSGLLSSPQASKWSCYMPDLGWYKYTTAVPMDILQDRLHCSVLCQYGSGAIKTRMPANWPQLLDSIQCLSFIISRLNLTWLKALCLFSIRCRLNLNWSNTLCWVSIDSRVVTLTLSAVPYL